jgi:RNA polymerase sigma factor (sigma-70 family)
VFTTDVSKVMSTVRNATLTPQREFEILIGPFLPGLMRTAWRFTGNRQDAEDLLQDVLTKLYPQLDTLRQVELLRPWLTRVLYRAFVDSSRRRKRDGARLSLVEDYDEDGDETISLADDESSTPHQQAEHAELQLQVARALNRLDDTQRALITLHDMEGHSIEEVALLMDIPAGTVKSRLHRLRARLRRAIKVEPFGTHVRVEDSDGARS